VRDNLIRIGKIDIPEINPIIGSSGIFLYRNKLEYTFSDKRWLTKEEVASGAKLKRKMLLVFIFPDFSIRFLILKSAIFT